MRQKIYTSTLNEALNNCGMELADLAEEMRDAFENTPEVFQSTTGKPREQAANDLEYACEEVRRIVLPGNLQNEEISWPEFRATTSRPLSRPVRRDNVVNCLNACLVRLSAEAKNEEIKESNAELGQTIEFLSRVFFPGMSGKRAA